MKAEVETAFKEMLDISTDVDKALLFTPDEVLASSFPAEAQADVLTQAQELVRLGELRATDMGSQPLTQLVVETGAGLVFLARETGAETAMTIVATGKKGSRIGLVLYDLKTCLRDAREATSVEGKEEA